VIAVQQFARLRLLGGEIDGTVGSAVSIHDLHQQHL
jgi:hypothetical protein